MKSADVLRILNVTRPTLTKYVKEGQIKATVKMNGQYDYDEESVFRFLNRDLERKSYIYACVSSSASMKDLEEQVELLKKFSMKKGVTVSGVYQDISDDISCEKRPGLCSLIEEIIAGRVQFVVVASKERVSRESCGFLD